MKPTTNMPRKIIIATKAEHADFLEHDGPWKKESDFKVEQDEQDRNEVVAHIELHARVFESFEATLVGGQLFGIRAGRRESPLPAVMDTAPTARPTITNRRTGK
jgi:hypothetical protein